MTVKAADSTAMTVPRLRIDRISKTFGRARVLREVGLDLHPGEIHGLIGQNGSGKSTLAKVLTGYHAPDPGGQVLVDGTLLRLPIRPLDARAHGLAVVHQSLGLVNDYTVVENLRAGRLRASRFSRRIDWRHELAEAREVLDRFGRSVPLEARVGSLPEEDRATVAIARAIQDAREGSGLIIFDESTRSLTRRSLERFYEMLDEVVSSGTAALVITHRLEEVVDAADRVTVLRDGCAVESGLPTAGLREADLAELVVGHRPQVARDVPTHRLGRGPAIVETEAAGDSPGISGATDGSAAHAVSDTDRSEGPDGAAPADSNTPADSNAPADSGTPASGTRPATIRLTGVSGKVLDQVDLCIEPGEVLGVTGLAGAGYEELPYLVAGARPARAGRFTVGSTDLDLTELDTRRAIAAGVALVPEGREHAGLAFELSVAENIALPRSQGHGGWKPVNRAAEHSMVRHWIGALDVRPPRPSMPVGKLSGGNQQKVLLAKWLATHPRLLALHEPTQAVDVGARQTIVETIRSAAATGCAVLVAGSDENELALLCDRVLVLRDGAVAEELTDRISPDAIVAATFASAARQALRPSARAQAEDVVATDSDTATSGDTVGDTDRSERTDRGEAPASASAASLTGAG
ncbi:ABC transporter [Frankia sp. R43]|uniref:sugar ABC transporter ATP-binding protein n=1 Tax=Frankia sp. R43 TaxID=269536 RepID=UPI0006CA21EC|nr:sugar ABC transporter ATP-binding protein [Frankia sp. R43]KPM54045.1 ABC transporter [Frankia sp. R43]